MALRPVASTILLRLRLALVLLVLLLWPVSKMHGQKVSYHVICQVTVSDSVVQTGQLTITNDLPADSAIVLEVHRGFEWWYTSADTIPLSVSESGFPHFDLRYIPSQSMLHTPPGMPVLLPHKTSFSTYLRLQWRKSDPREIRLGIQYVHGKLQFLTEAYLAWAVHQKMVDRDALNFQEKQIVVFRR